jgi:hypothetical protein
METLYYVVRLILTVTHLSSDGGSNDSGSLQI